MLVVILSVMLKFPELINFLDYMYWRALVSLLSLKELGGSVGPVGEEREMPWLSMFY